MGVGVKGGVGGGGQGWGWGWGSRVGLGVGVGAKGGRGGVGGRGGGVWVGVIRKVGTNVDSIKKGSVLMFLASCMIHINESSKLEGV